MIIVRFSDIIMTNKIHFKRQFLAPKASQSTMSCITKVTWDDDCLDCSLIISDGFDNLNISIYSKIDDDEDIEDFENHTVIIDRLINQLQEYRNAMDSAIKNPPKDQNIDLYEDDD